TIQSGSGLTVSTPLVVFGTTAAVNATGNSAMSFTSVTPGTGLTIQAQGGSTSTISKGSGANGISFTAAAGQNLAFTKNGVGSLTTSIAGGAITVTTSGAAGNQSIPAGLTLSADNRVTFSLSGGTFTNNGTVATSAVGS